MIRSFFVVIGFENYSNIMQLIIYRDLAETTFSVSGNGWEAFDINAPDISGYNKLVGNAYVTGGNGIITSLNCMPSTGKIMINSHTAGTVYVIIRVVYLKA